MSRVQNPQYFYELTLRGRFFKPYPAETDFLIIRGVLGLSQKYQVESLRKRALVHFDSGIPRRLFNSRLFNSLPHPASWKVKNLPDVLALCRDISASWMLPMVLYRICRAFDEKEIILGRSTGDVTLCFPPEEQAILLSGNLTLRTSTFTNFLNFLTMPEDLTNCTSRCFEWRMGRRIEAERLRNAVATECMFTSLTIKPPILDLCNECEVSLADRYKEACRKVDLALPVIFGLPDWDVLDDLRAIALA